MFPDGQDGTRVSIALQKYDPNVGCDRKRGDTSPVAYSKCDATVMYWTLFDGTQVYISDKKKLWV